MVYYVVGNYQDSFIVTLCYCFVFIFTILQQQENKEKLEHWFGRDFLLRVA